MTRTGDEERALLLTIARDAIAAHVTGQPEGFEVAALAERRAGVFVTIHCRGDLRGCIGRLEADMPLPRSVAHCAVAACSEDPRFPAVDSAELPFVTLEISVLGPMERAAGPADIEVGRHGLMIEKGWRRGLLLPQVAVEWTIWKFEAEVFGEETAH
jgi:AmmeMemoRadiSam system protein A